MLRTAFVVEQLDFRKSLQESRQVLCITGWHLPLTCTMDFFLPREIFVQSPKVGRRFDDRFGGDFHIRTEVRNHKLPGGFPFESTGYRSSRGLVKTVYISGVFAVSVLFGSKSIGDACTGSSFTT